MFTLWVVPLLVNLSADSVREPSVSPEQLLRGLTKRKIFWIFQREYFSFNTAAASSPPRSPPPSQWSTQAMASSPALASEPCESWNLPSLDLSVVSRYLPSVVGVAPFFTDNRALAIGICLCGSGVGTGEFSGEKNSCPGWHVWPCSSFKLHPAQVPQFWKNLNKSDRPTTKTIIIGFIVKVINVYCHRPLADTVGDGWCAHSQASACSAHCAGLSWQQVTIEDQGPASTWYSTRTRNFLFYSNSTRTKHYSDCSINFRNFRIIVKRSDLNEHKIRGGHFLFLLNLEKKACLL